MFEILKQSVFTSIGLANMTKEKVAELVSEAARAAQLTEQQAKEFLEEVDRRRELAQRELTAQIDGQIDHALIQLGILKSGVGRTAEDVQSSLSSLVEQRVQEAVERLGLARSADVEALAGRMDLLEKKLAS